MTVHLMAWIFACLFCAASPVFAGPVEEVAGFFRPATGVVIMQTGGEYLIDLDATKGVRAGDLLTVLVPGEKIVHPVTGETLGSLDTLKGVFQVTRVKSGYSYIGPVGKAETLNRGDTVRLWEQVPAAFRTENGGDEALGRELQAALPHFDWRSDSQDVPLLFVATPERLEVRGPGGTLLNAVPLAAVPAPRQNVGVIAPAPAAPAGAIVPVAPEQTPAAIVHNRQTATAGLWMSPEFAGEAVGVHVADLDGDGRQEVALAFPYRLEVGRITGGNYSRLASLDLGFGQKVVTLDGADLDGDGRDELYLTAASEGELQSLAAVFSGELKIFQKRLPWYLRAVELPGEGRVLLGQRVGRLDEDFGGPIFRVLLQKGNLTEGNPVDLPPTVKIFGFLPIPVQDDNSAYIQINDFDELKVVDRAGTTLWKSEEKAGGSEAFFERADPTKNPARGPATRSVFMQQRLEPGSDGSYLIPVNEGQRILARVRSFDKSSLRAMTWNGFALQELWHTQPQNGYLADFRVADADNDGQAEIVQALVFARDGLMSKGRSALALFELQP